MSTNINYFFQQTLGANVKNPRWSWGAIEPLSNCLFLRIWNDHIISDHGRDRVQVYWKIKRNTSNGYNERLKHLEFMQNGARTFGVLCESTDPNATKQRQIKDFDKEKLAILEELTEDDRFRYAYITGYIPTSQLERFRTSHTTLAVDIKSILAQKKFGPTTQEALIDARVGQGAFRVAVLSLWNNRCAVTGSAMPDVIRASHIKPWRDSTNAERLDPSNGLPLVASLDALFDAGLISFDAKGRMLISQHIPPAERQILNLNSKSLNQPISDETLKYLAYHRSNLYRL